MIYIDVSTRAGLEVMDSRRIINFITIYRWSEFSLLVQRSTQASVERQNHWRYPKTYGIGSRQGADAETVCP